MTNQRQSLLSINEISVPAHIGCSAEERSQPQPVRMKIVIAFSENPKALETDNLDDTVCYHDLTKDIVAACKNREFNLVEHMAKVVYDVTAKRLSAGTKAVVQVTKLEPPVDEITGGVTFSYGDLIQ